MATPKNTYFAAQDSTTTATALLEKAQKWFMNLESTGYLQKTEQLYAAYYGCYYTDFSGGHQITFMGEQGELTGLAVNHLRNIATHIKQMITASRPAMQARAANNDYKSLVQTKLGNDLLDYYMREKRMEENILRAVEMAIVLGSGYVKLEWNPMLGDIYDVLESNNEETGEIEKTPIHEGDIVCTNLSHRDVVHESTKEHGANQNYIIIRYPKNRFDIVAKYPDKEEDILKLETVSDVENFRFHSWDAEQSDDIFVYEFYHKATESMPEGRFMQFVSGETVLVDGPMPYLDIPIYRISPADILGTPYGYTPLFDLLPIQDAINSLYSIVMTNNNAFGVQSVLMPRGCSINPASLMSGMNLIEYDAQFGKPEAMQLTATPAETFKFIEMLEKAQETLSGISSVTRGKPEASLESGTALAMVQSMSIQFMNGLQQSYVRLVEDMGTGLLNILKIMAHVPRIAQIAGKDNRAYVKEFTGEDLSTINRVIVDIGNPLSATTAGRIEMADHLLQMGIVQNPEQYITVMNTGRLTAMTDPIQDELFLVRAENEKMVAGEDMHVVATERHRIHIDGHSCVMADPDLKNDPELTGRVLAHIQEHIDMLRTVDPDLLMLRGEQPLGPVGGSPANQPETEQMINQSQMQSSSPSQVQAPPPGTMDTQQTGSQLPAVPAPPGEFASLPTDPAKAAPLQ